jgi:hypothetical protein
MGWFGDGLGLQVREREIEKGGEEGTINRVLTTQMGFVTTAEATPAVIAAPIWIRYSGRSGN